MSLQVTRFVYHVRDTEQVSNFIIAANFGLPTVAVRDCLRGGNCENYSEDRATYSPACFRRRKFPCRPWQTEKIRQRPVVHSVLPIGCVPEGHAHPRNGAERS
jgi:hypothetical protein